jgi:hypothetical protein
VCSAFGRTCTIASQHGHKRVSKVQVVQGAKRAFLRPALRIVKRAARVGNRAART